MKKSVLDHYRKLAAKCHRTDYGSPVSIRAHNRAVNEMYKIVEKTASEGEQGVQTLATLLDESPAREWLAFQLLDRVGAVSPELERKCLQIIQSVANDPSRHADSFGATEWLRRWRQAHKRDPASHA